jgi:hypothetical protein
MLSVILVAACATEPTATPAVSSTAPSPAATPEPAATPPTPASTTAPTPTPSPSRSPFLSPSPTPGPVANGWPVTFSADGWERAVVGANGTTYAWADGPERRRILVALDTAGRMKPGWPFRLPSSMLDETLVVAVDGSLLVGLRDDDEAGYELHRLGADGHELPGWPFRDDGAACGEPPVADPEGTTYLGCVREAGGALEIIAIDRAGRVVRGWPVRLGDGGTFGSVWWGSDVQVGTDGTVYALTVRNDGEGFARLWAFAADGSPRPGWPVTLGSYRAGFMITPQGRILVGSYIPPEVPEEGLCAEARETVLAELDTGGRMVAGWPRTAAGWASESVVAADATVYYLTSERVFARAPDGTMRPGWPVAIPPVSPNCGSYGPFLAPDGTVHVMADGLRAFGPDGRPKPGWPYRPASGFAGRACFTDGVDTTIPAIGPDGTVYVATRVPGGDPDRSGRLEVVALDRAGRVAAGWPYRLPFEEPGHVDLLEVAGGRLYVTLTSCGQSESGTSILAIDPDGTPSD